MSHAAHAIPLARPDITQREIDAVVEVMQSGTLSIGPKVEEFEARCAKLTGRQHAIAVSSGTTGLHAMMIAAGIGRGDEVITTPFSFVASANCILYVDAKPVFVDIEPLSMNLDVRQLDAALTPKTKAIVGVEAFGHPHGMPELEDFARRKGLILIEDACEGFGGYAGRRPIGSFGLASVFGFYPNKQITTGEGGMIVTDDADFAAACRALRNQGREGMAWLAHQRLGFNYRLSEIAAAIGNVQIDRLPEILESRRHVAHEYMERLMTSKYVILPTLGERDHVSWFVFVIKLNDLFEPGDRDEVMKHLRAEGIGCNNYFPPIHLQPYMAEKFGFKPGQFPVTEYVSARTLALPFFAALDVHQIHHVCDVLEKACERVLLRGAGGRLR
jgi:perosamine synthetase